MTNLLALWVDPDLVFAIALGVGVGAGLALFFGVLFSSRFARSRLTVIAEELGMKFDPAAQSLRTLGLERLWKFRYWNDRRYLLHGGVAGVEAALVEVRTLDPKVDPMQRPGFYQLVCFRLPGRSLPTFHMVKFSGNRLAVVDSLPGALELPEGLPTERAAGESAEEFRQRALKALEEGRPKLKTRERHEVALADNPGFSSFFIVSVERKEDEPALRKLFTREVQDYFMQTRDEKWWEVQGAGDWVGFHSSPVNVPLTANPYRRMQEEVRRLHDVFARATSG